MMATREKRQRKMGFGAEDSRKREGGGPPLDIPTPETIRHVARERKVPDDLRMEERWGRPNV